MKIDQLTIRLPKSEIAFLQSFAARHNVTVSQLIDHYVQQLRVIESYEHHPDVEKFAGILPAGENVRERYLDFLAEKHR